MTLPWQQIAKYAAVFSSSVILPYSVKVESETLGEATHQWFLSSKKVFIPDKFPLALSFFPIFYLIG